MSINHVAFRLLSEEDIQTLSVLNILYPNPFVHGKIKEHGLHDLRLGATTQFDPCQTCHESIETCNGHYGHISFTYPIYHAMFYKTLQKILNCLCFNCFQPIVRTEPTNIDGLYAQSKSKLRCEQCKFPKHKIELRKLDLKIIWTLPNKTSVKQIFSNTAEQEYATALSNHLDAGFLLFCLRQLSPTVRHALLGAVEPSCFLLMNLLVPPSIIRPYTSQGKRVGLNELTVKLNEIVASNATLHNQTDPVWFRFTQKLFHKQFDCTRFPPDWIWTETLCEHHQLPVDARRAIYEYSVDWSMWNADNHTQCLRRYVIYWMEMRTQRINTKWVEQYMLLKYYGCVFFDNGLRLHKPDKKTVRANAFSKGIEERIKGKYGRFRWNLLGKRVDQCARTVIVPESFLDIDELSVPLFIAKQLTVSETAQAYNKSKLQRLIERGSTEWPGANSIVKKSTNNTIELELLSDMERKTLANHLEYGDMIQRHLQDGDICLFNRQPSLHRSSMMGHRVRVLSNGKGFGLHECVTHTYNADFDGDEMNFFVVQIFEARAEVQEFMMVEHQMYNHQNLGLAFGMKQNPLLVLALLSSLDQWYEREEAMQLILWWSDHALTLPEPSICKPQPLWSSRQLVSIVFPSTFCYHRHDVVIEQGEWITGVFNKKHLGTGEGQLFHVLLHQMGSHTTKRVFSDLHKFASEWLLHHGFSCGLSDCFHANEEANEKRTRMLDVANQTVQASTDAPETKTNQFLNTLLSFTQPTTRPENRIMAMVSSGSKGSMNNLTQIMCMLGQQNIDGKRMQKPFHPVFLREQTPKNQGLVGKSYLEGLDATEFYLHCAAGRKGLVDTAVSTATTGYSQRKLIKTFESIYVTWDGFVRTTSQQIVNTSYGICNLDVRFLQPYRLQTTLPAFPDLWEALKGKALDAYLTQQMFLGQNIQHSKTKYVHVSSLKSTPMTIEIPFAIGHAWTKFLEQHPFDPNPQDVNLRDMFRDGWHDPEHGPVHVRSPKYFIFCVLMADWFEPSLCNSRPFREDFVKFAKHLYDHTFVASGEAVGAVAAESVAEPATQMTLNTFHFAGILQQNVTNGIPRLRELLFVQDPIKTPMMYAQLFGISHTVADLHSFCETLVQHTVHYFTRSISLQSPFLRIEFHHERLLQYHLTPFSVSSYIRHQLMESVVKINKQAVEVKTDLQFIPDSKRRVILQIRCDPFVPEVVQSLQQWMTTDWIISGVPGVELAHVYRLEENTKDTLLSLMGNNNMSMRDVWDVFPIDYRRTFSNNITEVQATLGIDAAKYVLFKEIKASMSLEGSMVHDTHLRLIVDVMTCTGKLLPTDRNGLAELAPENILTRASFEKNMNVLCQAAMLGQEQDMTGVSESIMVGSDLAIGTGASKMIPMDQTQLDPEITQRMFVTTNDSNDFVEFPGHVATHESDWEPYFNLMDQIQSRLTTQCLQYMHTLRQVQPPATIDTNNQESYLSRKRKQNELVPTDYRPSSPILLAYDESYNENSSMNVEFGTNDDMKEGDKLSSISETADASNSLTVEALESVISCIRSTVVSDPFALMHSLVSKQTLLTGTSLGSSVS